MTRFFRKNLSLAQLFFKILLTNPVGSAIISHVLNIGVSPSGKASDSDSDISGVRIPAPQPNKQARQRRAFLFVWLGCPARRSAQRIARRGWKNAVCLQWRHSAAKALLLTKRTALCGKAHGALWTNSPRLGVGALHPRGVTRQSENKLANGGLFVFRSPFVLRCTCILF